MPAVLQGVDTADNYDDQCEFSPDKNTAQIVFVGTDNPYYVQAYKLDPRMPQSSPVSDGVERLYPAGGGDSFTGPIAGCKFRSAAKGMPAVIYGQQAFKTDVISASPVFGGGVTGFGGASMINGITGFVNSDGSVGFGSGYTVNHTGTGVYIVTFDSPLAAAPVCVAWPVYAGGAHHASLDQYLVSTANGFVVESFIEGSDGASPLDSPFNFVAIVPQ